MKPLRKTITFSCPVTAVRLTRTSTVRQDWEARLAEAEREAYERGRVEGEKALSEQLVSQRTELIELRDGLLRSLRNTLPDVRHEVEELLIQLAHQVAQKLVGDLPISSDFVDAAVREALNQAEEGTILRIELHPEDLSLMEKMQSGVMHRSEVEGIEVVSSNEISRGGCLVHTRFGLIDARRETRQELLQAALAS